MLADRLRIHSVATAATVKPLPHATLRTSRRASATTGRGPYGNVEGSGWTASPSVADWDEAAPPSSPPPPLLPPPALPEAEEEEEEGEEGEGPEVLPPIADPLPSEAPDGCLPLAAVTPEPLAPPSPLAPPPVAADDGKPL